MNLPLPVRLALTALAPVVVWAAPHVPLPRFDGGQIERTFGVAASEVNLSAFALGLAPLLSAFLVVEVVALAVPRWRRLRTGGPDARRRLGRATRWAAVAIALVQSTALAFYLEKMDGLEDDVRLSRLVVVLTLVGGTCVAAVLAQELDRIAFGGGFALLVTASIVPSLRPLGELVWASFAGPGASPSVLLLPVLLATVVGTIAMLRGWPSSAAIPLPACGLLPVHWAGAVAALGIVPAGMPTLVFAGALTAGLAVALGFLFNRPSKLAAFLPEAPAQWRRAIAWSAVYVIGLAIAGGLLAPLLDVPWLTLVPLAAVIACVLDVIAEAQATRQHGALVPVWPEHRLYAVESVRRALEARGIPSHARSVHQRALWHFFAPFIPVQILVPQAQATEAGRLLSDRHA